MSAKGQGGQGSSRLGAGVKSLVVHYPWSATTVNQRLDPKTPPKTRRILKELPGMGGLE